MSRTKYAGLVGLWCIFAAFPAVAQKEQSLPLAELPNGDPFKIASGSSFTASGTQQKKEPAEPPTSVASRKISADLAEALNIIEKNHVSGSKTNTAKLTKSSINTMLRVLDPHSSYFDAGEFREMLEDQHGEYFGIGTTIVNYEKNGVLETFVISTVPASPAAKGGLRYGDRIVAVNGENVSGKLSSEVRDKVRGRIGSTVHLTIEHADGVGTELVALRRARVPNPSITDAYILRNGTGYVDLTSGFTETTADELNAALKFLHGKGMRSLILDLRGNPGGILDQAVKVAGKFLPTGSVIATQRGRHAVDERVWRSATRIPETISLVVLVDNNSASASEIVAGALQDYDRALIVGGKTFGKGLVQSVIGLPFGSGLTLTTAKYFTPSGRSIQRDYSDGSLYDYYNHKKNTPAVGTARYETRTKANRRVFGGDGIAPDMLVQNVEMKTSQIALLDPLFFFTREVIAGRVEGLKKYKSGFGRTGGVNFAQIDAYSAFRAFVEKSGAWPIPTAAMEQERSFINLRVGYNLTSAEFGQTASNHFLAQQDRTVAKALESLPQALQLARTSTQRR